ncbi:MAG: hypothetical protein EPN60_05290 [Nevskiaceae bacterium]|nr:MAG: hypothetical protein EPN60_05290 [Nevskiaceae bacterium]
MGDRFQNAVEVPDVLVDPSAPEAGYLRFFGKNKRPVARNSDGEVMELSRIARQLFFDSATGSPQSVVVPSGIYTVRFKLVGAGAPGAVGSNGNTAGGGGGAGGGLEGELSVSPGDVIQYFVPAGGSSADAWLGASSGSDAIVAKAGTAGTVDGVPGNGGGFTIGATHASRVFGIPGQRGSFGDRKDLLSGDNIRAGDGGSSIMGFGGPGGRNTSTSAGNGSAATGYGAGGGGATNGSTAGPGAPAAIQLWY